MISADTCVTAAADRLTRYRAALDSLAAHAGITERPRELFETCEHMTPIAQDCDSCEPLLDHDPGFGEEVKAMDYDDPRHPEYDKDSLAEADGNTVTDEDRANLS